MEYKKALTWSREVRYATRSGPGVTSLGGNQARMNKQYSGQPWRALRGRSEPALGGWSGRNGERGVDLGFERLGDIRHEKVGSAVNCSERMHMSV